MKLCFLIIHYKQNEITARCINSILKYRDTSIVVYDNGSGDNSFQVLHEKYKNYPNVYLQTSNINQGYSRGVNNAYKFIENKIIFDYLIVTNNDIVFEQKDFIEELNNVSLKYDNLIIGPDIMELNNFKTHQSPLRDLPRNYSRIIRDIRLYKFKEKCTLTSLIIEKILSKVSKKTRYYNDYSATQDDVCLSGACIIISNKYFELYDTIFYPETFFYHEEEILYYKLKNDAKTMLYYPKLWVFHDHSISTNSLTRSKISRAKFRYKNNISSLLILKKFIEQVEGENKNGIDK